MKSAFVRYLLPIVLCAACLGATASAAEPTQADKAAARALFDEGRALAASGKYELACPKLETSQKLDPGVGTQFNLADCYEHQGKTASAWSLYLEVASRTRAEGQKDREETARARAKALEPKLSRMTVTVAAELGQLQGLVIRRDGVEVISGVLGSAIPVDPGLHKVEATAPGRKTWTKTVEVAGEGASVTVGIPLLEAEAASSAAPAAPGPVPAASAPIAPAGNAPTGNAPTTAPAQSGSGLRTLGYVGLTVGAVSLVAGGVAGVMAMGKKSDLEGSCTDDRRCAPEFSGDIDSYNTLRTVSSIGFIVGAIGVAGGAVLLWQGKSDGPASSQKASLHPFVGPGHVGMMGRF